ncbi:glycosyltransferase family 4 protein [Clostridiaceae bacterium 14S0207]|nr:glycosyltransferase family 4 protein [Clostridiaceae bacterium 14S0207]
MHVMFIPSWYSNSRNKVHGSFFKEQALALSESGVKISIAFNEIWPLTLMGKVQEKKGLNIEIEDGLKTYRYRNYNYLPKNPLMFKIFNKRMDLLYKNIVKNEGKVDLIHAHSSFWGGISAAYISKKYNIPLVITEHSSLRKAKYVKESYRKYILNAYKNASKLIAVGEGLKKELEEFTGRDDIIFIPNMLDFNMFKPEKVHKNEEFTFFSLAFLEGEKGMDILIKTFAKTFKDKKAKLVIGGDGSQKQELEKLSGDLQVKDKVEFLGALSREEVVTCMNKCDSFVLASRHETFGIVYIEALACGKPVIGTYNGGAEGIINSHNGLIVPIDDECKLGNAMKNIIKNYNEYNAMDIIEQCKARYSKENIVNEILKIYNTTI